MRTSGVSAVLAVPARAALGARSLHACLLLGLVMLSLHLGLLLALLLHLLLALGLFLGTLLLHLLHLGLLLAFLLFVGFLDWLLALGWLLRAWLQGLLRRGGLHLRSLLRMGTGAA